MKDCATNNPVPGIINATKYVTGGGNLCYTLVDSAGVLPPKTNSTGVLYCQTQLQEVI
ncbi:MAG: hypothetical protein IPJ43_20570 [Saprospiraceae bacterium]|nr:hypothetical protein [Saprospiraceae bacterium]